ncbi:uncharacterized protein Z520_09023 [Fonsecaea multimorphosa CBS 102226]|uniref:Major facilitator superfamily (MFS) profile domain-containing protein n=1 Tax=Fonsecaea multimorphosa CBS 102226 TaxID=1442371 RepID=A0A0D2JP35_9EURO|nr:uncharacterized protein Z520_09023 [Fonsecaea multimorphosa CBS 102226]KIX95107.1 hypothetical protein Z520_09023 [Fonsecaea multimorphosa CBS 102226]OAL20828.1 hypothetical protein AYO22_08456 [Fonsecaea multimorphosa]
MAIPGDKIVASITEHDEETQQPVKDNNRVDDAHHFVQENADIEWTEEEERKLLWKIDVRIIVLLLLGNICMACDSGAYGIAAIFGLITDLKLYTIVSVNPPVLSLTKYSWTNSILTFAALVGQYPLLLLAQKLPVGKYLTGIILYSGALALLFLTLRDFAGTMALKFFYGFQGVSLPVCILLSSMWWKTEEQPLRIGLWMCGASVGAIVGQALDYGAASIKGEFHNSPWKWIYLVVGSITVGFSIIFGIFFPDSPMKARFLSERERNIAVRRLQKNQTGIQTRKLKWAQVRAAFTDLQTWLICVTGFAFAFATAGLGSFGALILTGFGFSNFKTIQLFMPCSGIVIINMLVSGLLATKFKKSRIVIAMGFLVPSIVSYILLWKLPRDNKGGLLTSFYFGFFFYGALIQTLGLLASNIGGFTKKTTANAMIFAASSIGGIAGPFAFKGSEAAEGYPTGMIILMISMVAAEVSMAILLLYYKALNRRRDRAINEPGAADALRSTLTEGQAAFLDLTDHENPYFRYTY